MKSQTFRLMAFSLVVIIGSTASDAAQGQSCKVDRSTSERSCSVDRSNGGRSGGGRPERSERSGSTNGRSGSQGAGRSDRPSQSGSDRGRDSGGWGQNRSVFDPNLNGGVTTEFRKDRNQPTGRVTDVETRVVRSIPRSSGNIAPNRSVFDPNLNGGVVTEFRRDSGPSAWRNRPAGRFTNVRTQVVPASNPAVSFVVGTQTPGGFARQIGQLGGVVPVSIRENLRELANSGKFAVILLSEDSVLLVERPSERGHRYIALNSIGRPNKYNEHIWAGVKRDPVSVLPFSYVRPLNGRAIAVGNEYDLIVGTRGPQVVNRVVVTAETPHTFTLTTKPGHILQGSVTHGILTDRTGEKWVFQEGVGVRGELPWLQAETYSIAGPAWNFMANNIRNRVVGR